MIYRRKVFHSVGRSELEVMTAGIRNSSPTTVSAGSSNPVFSEYFNLVFSIRTVFQRIWSLLSIKNAETGVNIL